MREAEAAGGITAADRTRLETLALRERDEALRRIEGTTRRVASIPRPDRETEREINDIIRERERLIQNNENAQERYVRQLQEIALLATRAEAAGRTIDPETLLRAGEQATEAFNRTQLGARETTQQTNDVACDLGLTFSSAFEDGRGNAPPPPPRTRWRPASRPASAAPPPMAVWSAALLGPRLMRRARPVG